MKAESFLNSISATTILALGLMFMLIPADKAQASTVTIYGWLVPDATHLTNGLMPLVFPLGGVAAFVWIAKAFKVQGDAIVYLVLLGLLLGSIGADLSVGGGSAVAYIPFGMIVVAAILLFLWWWNN